MATKKLAKELGLLRQRSQSSKKKSLVSNQIFSYLIVIDFESTCWREKNNYSHEIIEFPAVLLNTSTGEVESEFHTYVQPQEHPILSGFCTELTGITQMQVEAGIPLQICLSRFNRWLQNLQLSLGLVFPTKQQKSSEPPASQKLCTFLTWSDWDLGVCLLYECKRKQLHKPDVLNSWIDLRSSYRLFYNRKPKGLNGALQDLGIQFAGREHSGLDDSRNTAQLAARMMRDGCVLKTTQSLVRTPLMVKPINRNSTEHNRKDKSSTDKEEIQLQSNKPSSSKFSSKSCPKKSEVIMNKLNTENSKSLQQPLQICQSLISPKTLLNGVTTSLWRSAAAETIPKASSTIIRNVPSAHGNSSSHVLCSTTVGCISDQADQTLPSLPGGTGRPAEEEEGAECFLMETEDRCDSYDDVVLEGDDDVIDDDGRCDWKEPDDRDLSGNQVILRSTNNTRYQIDVFNRFNNVRKHSTRLISEISNSFAVPTTVDLDSNQHKLGHKTCLQTHRLNNGPRKHAKTSTLVPLAHKSFIPEKTSSPNSLFSRPKSVKQTPKPSFSIFTDPPKPPSSSSGSSICTSRNVLSSLSTNTSSSRTICSFTHLSETGAQRITSPLCSCGRRAKRQVVSNGGPNNGRGFYCCPVRRSGGGGRAQKRCDFFKWESALMRRSVPCLPGPQKSVGRKSC
ncbi:ERI1 exoribonuclease 2 [Antennarius striatus]|uniref:ERI1 exoribonuclease 2 n=1 Tax=Antennarius striatus TaxID=241820 RepID=UPI0035B27F1D